MNTRIYLLGAAIAAILGSMPVHAQVLGGSVGGGLGGTLNGGLHQMDVTTQGTAGQITITTWTETVSNAGWAAGDEVYFLVCRDGDGTAGTDSMSGDARLHSFSVSVPRAE